MHNWIGLVVLLGIVGFMAFFLLRGTKLKSNGELPENHSSTWWGSDPDGHSDPGGHSETH
jgi:hypothetical protein